MSVERCVKKITQNVVYRTEAVSAELCKNRMKCSFSY